MDVNRGNNAETAAVFLIRMYCIVPGVLKKIRRKYSLPQERCLSVYLLAWFGQRILLYSTNFLMREDEPLYREPGVTSCVGVVDTAFLFGVSVIRK
tara:strand:+ start:490 stop:777 length:288 start_codon:yes stop_codon:yes gene_type:complete